MIEPKPRTLSSLIPTISSGMLIAVLALVGFAASATPAGAYSTTFVDGTEVVDNRILVRFEPGTGPKEQVAAAGEVDGETVRSFTLVPGLKVIRLPDGADVERAVAEMEAQPGVARASLNEIRYVNSSTPNDPFYSAGWLWGQNNTGQTFDVGANTFTGTVDADMDAPEAWDLSRGSSQVTVAVIDTGIQANHPDLSANLWTNPGEIAGNSIDDDGNGKIDDVHGWDFVNGDANPNDDDPKGHGTHVAGTIGARGNNGTGVTGLNWTVQIAPLKACNAVGSCSIENTIAALQYAVAEGIPISNNSYGGLSSTEETDERLALQAARTAGHLFVAAAGNDGVDTDPPAERHFPSGYTLDNIISVAATTLNDNRASYSNYGATTVDVGAPGSQILSTVPASTYAWANGTSMASPQVAGLAALIKARYPSLTYSQIRDQIIGNTRPIAALSGKSVSGGVINAFDALDFGPGQPTITSGPASLTNSQSATFSFTGETVGAAPTFECRVDSNTFAACTSPRSYTGLANGLRTFEVRQIDRAGKTSSAAAETWTVDTVAPETSITSPPSGPIASTSQSIAFTSPDATATFECSLDGSSYVACTSPRSLTGLGQGSHTFEVRAIDTSGNVDASPASATWTVDTVAPETSITSPPSGPIASTSQSVAFTSPDATATFECRLDGSSYVACTSPRLLTGLAQGSHSFQVRAKDPAGNTDGTPPLAIWTVDTVAPSAPNITAGPSGPVTSTSASFSFTGEESATFECRIDSESFAACDSPVSYSSLDEGSHTFEVRQADSAGNQSAEASRTWTVDTALFPAPTITGAPVGEVNSTSATISFTGVPGAIFSCSIDSEPFEVCVSPWAGEGLSSGPHTFEVKQDDGLGKVSSAAQASWEVLKVATVTPAVGQMNPDGTIAISGATGDLSYLCGANGADLEPCEAPLVPDGLTNGTHTIEVVIVDADGNRSIPVENEVEISGAPVPPAGPVGVTLASGGAYTRTTAVPANFVWPVGARKMILSVDGTFGGTPSPLSPAASVALPAGQGNRTVSARFLGPADVSLATVDDSIYLDPNLPGLTSARVTKRKGRSWSVAVKASDSGSGLSKVQFSTSRSKPGATARASATISLDRSKTVVVKSAAAPLWSRVLDRAGNTSAWKSVR